MKILERDGLHLAADSISYARVFSHIEETYDVKITRGSVHERIWASHDDFRRDVLAELVSSSFPLDFFLVGREGIELIREIAGKEKDLETARLQIVKHVSAWVGTQMLESDVYTQVQSAKAIATRSNDPQAASAIQRILEERSQQRLASRRGTFRFLMEGIGLRLKPSVGLSMDAASDLFFQTSWALVAGAHLNAGAGCVAVLDELPGTASGEDEDQSWTIFSLGLRSLVEFLFEVDPDAAISPRIQELAVTAPPDDNGRDEEPDGPTILMPEKSGRRTRGELKRLVLQGGVETLKRDGMNLRPESLSYAAVFAQVYADQGLVVNRASVHKRFWSSHLEFCLEVMGLALRAEPTPDPKWVSDVLAIQTATDQNKTRTTHQTALDTLQAISRATLRPMLDCPVMRRRMLIKAAIPDQPESSAKDALKDLVVETELAIVAEDATLIKENVIDLGYEVRPSIGLDAQTALEALAVLVHIMSVGASFEQLAGSAEGDASYKLPRVDGSDEMDEWSTVSIAARAAFETLYRRVER